jgi:hypothetical protein
VLLFIRCNKHTYGNNDLIVTQSIKSVSLFTLGLNEYQTIETWSVLYWINFKNCVRLPAFWNREYAHIVCSVQFCFFTDECPFWSVTFWNKIPAPKHLTVSGLQVIREFLTTTPNGVGFQVLTTASVKMFWGIGTCSLVRMYRHFRGDCCLRRQGD